MKIKTKIEARIIKYIFFIICAVEFESDLEILTGEDIAIHLTGAKKITASIGELNFQ
jgi:hypothetical protein